MYYGAYMVRCVIFVFFFQAEDGIRDTSVTGVQTCALPICRSQYPAVALTVTLKGVTIEYRHSVRRDDTDSARPTEGYFRIGADLAGNVQARQGEKWFTDAAEISAALL